MKRISNKVMAFVLTALFIFVFWLFSLLNTSIGDSGRLEQITIFTSTSAPTLAGDGWWDNVPTPISVEAYPLKTTPTP
jgi:hypothetical protein